MLRVSQLGCEEWWSPVQNDWRMRSGERHDGDARRSRYRLIIDDRHRDRQFVIVFAVWTKHTHCEIARRLECFHVCIDVRANNVCSSWTTEN
jgi:hypothetical protein